MNYAIFPRLACRMDKNVLFNTAMLPLSSLQRHAASLVTTHRGHFLPTSASHEFLHPCLWAGRQHFAQENTPCSFSPLERGLYAKTGQREQTRTALATAIELYHAMDMTFWLPQAEATLAQVGRAEQSEGGKP